jgi:hypothetical protein
MGYLYFVKPLFVIGSSGTFVTSPKDLDTLITRSLDVMLPGIKPKLSLLNSLYELKDFKSLPRTLNKLKKIDKSLIKFGLTSKTLKQIKQAGLDVFLQGEFNIMPLWSDIRGLWTSVLNTRKELQKLIAGQYLRKHSHFAIPLTDEYQSVSKESVETLPDWSVPTTVNRKKETVYSRCMFHATVEYSYTLPFAVTEDDILLALLDQLGVNLNPAIIWNAIPWSFVVDWVINVSKWLDQFKSRNLEPGTHIYQYCWSLHVIRSTRSYVGLGSTELASQTDEESFIRQPVPIGGLRSFVTSGLNSKELSLGTALALSRD